MSGSKFPAVTASASALSLQQRAVIIEALAQAVVKELRATERLDTSSDDEYGAATVPRQQT
jgi:hypothetical protein